MMIRRFTPVSFGHKFLLRRRGVNQQYICFAFLPHGHGLAGSYRRWSSRNIRFFLKHRDEDIQKAGVLRACRRGQNDIFLLSLDRISIISVAAKRASIPQKNIFRNLLVLMIDSPLKFIFCISLAF